MKKRIQLPTNRANAKRARGHLTVALHVFLMRQAALIADQVVALRNRTGKADISQDELDRIEEILVGIDFAGWASLAGTIDPIIADAVYDAGYETLRILALDVTADRAIFNVVNNEAVEYAKERSAGLVGMRRLRDGTLIENQNADYAITDATRDMLKNDVASALSEGWTNQELASKLADNYAFSAERAMTIARTETINASNQGTLAGFKASGVVLKKEWTTAEDDLVSEECEANGDQGPIDLDEMFESGDDAPPAHPNAVMAGGSFASYGVLEEIVRADYHGPAILLATAQGRYLTVGPNHPVLTRRGMIKARSLAKCDELVYDLRSEESALAAHADFQYMPFVEDAFETLLAAGCLSRVTTATHDLHGDRTFCKGEIEVVEPASCLLPELDPGDVEQLRKGILMRSDVQAVALSGNGPSDLTFDSVDLTPASGVCGRLASHFTFLPIQSIHYAEWEGKAFDATTASGLYNYGGFVVSNCRCTLVGLTELDVVDNEVATEEQ